MRMDCPLARFMTLTLSIFRRHRRQPSGFALVMVLSLMAILILLVMGLLSLSARQRTIQSAAQAQAEAQANARLALQLALGQLQKAMGPDQRVSTTADQLADAADPSKSRAHPTRSRWTGVYASWASDQPSRPEPVFRTWLVSGDASALARREIAETTSAAATPPVGRPAEIPVLGSGTLGANAASLAVNAPLVAAGGTGAVGWWTSDENVKALVPSTESRPANARDARAIAHSAPRRAAEWMRTPGGNRPLSALGPADTRSSLLLDTPQLSLVAETPDVGALYHDLTTRAGGLLTNVRGGGFRRDLSFHLEKPLAQAPVEPLFREGGTDGTNMAELWTYYSLPGKLRRGASFNYTTGGRMDRNTPYLQLPATQAEMVADPHFFHIQPAFIRCQTILSFYSLPVGNANNQTVYRLHVVVDPVVTLWNPLDVPVVFNAPGSTPVWNSIKYWLLPYDIEVSSGTRTMRASFLDIMGESHYLTLRAGSVEPIVLKPGEVLVYSQGANTPISLGDESSRLDWVDGRAGWNYGGGRAWRFRKGGLFFDGTGGESFTYQVTPNRLTATGTQQWGLIVHGYYYKEDRSSGTTNAPGGSRESADIGGLNVDRLIGSPSSRLYAAENPGFFGGIGPSDGRPYTFQEISPNGRGKAPFMLFTFAAKTETGSQRPGRFLARLNPKAMHTDFQGLSDRELETHPFEIHVRPLVSWRHGTIEVSPDGTGYFGGGFTAQYGTPRLITHAVPREPPHSLGAFQHAFANGFPVRSSTSFPLVNPVGGANPPMPQVMHPIGNSIAPSILPPDRVSSTLEGGRPLLDYAYLTNQALFDDWFLSGIAPQTVATFSPRRPHRQVAEAFFRDGVALPNPNYRPALGAIDAQALVNLLFRGSLPQPDAAERVAAYLSIQGMFNINSTSVEAWKAVLAGLKGLPAPVSGPAGGDDLATAADGVPVAALLAPVDQISPGEGTVDVLDPAQWIGRRVLTESDVDSLARAITREVRRRGPFLSLGDFVNRRVGGDKSLARTGALQAALDDPATTVNKAFTTGNRSTPPISGEGRDLAFPEAESGPSAHGIPGIVKQADLLTPLAPVISARSDTFRVRAYGEKSAPGGRVLARAWCEAVFERAPDFLSEDDSRLEKGGQLVPTNQNFGRRFRLVSFRWLSPDEV